MMAYHGTAGHMANLLSQRVAFLEETVKTMTDNIETQCRWVRHMAEEMAKTREKIELAQMSTGNILNQVLQKMDHFRMEFHNNLQALADKVTETPMVYIVDGNGNVNVGSSLQSGQVGEGDGAVGPPSEPIPVDLATVKTETETLSPNGSPSSNAGSSQEFLEQRYSESVVEKNEDGHVAEVDGNSKNLDSVAIQDPHGVPRTGSSSQKNVSSCPYCPRQFEHNHSRSLHIRSCKKKYEASVKKLADTESSGSNSSNENSLRPSTSSGSKSPKSAHLKSLDNMIKCDCCQKCFPTRHQLKSHMRVHTGDRPYVCYICSIKFAHGGNLIKHIKSKHPDRNPYICRLCPNNFKTKLEIQQHRKICTLQKKYPAIVVGKDSSLTSGSSATCSEESSRDSMTSGHSRSLESEDTVTASETDEESQPFRSVSSDPRSSQPDVIPVPERSIGILEQSDPAAGSFPLLPRESATLYSHHQIMAERTFECSTLTNGQSTPSVRNGFQQHQIKLGMVGAVPLIAPMQFVKDELEDLDPNREFD